MATLMIRLEWYGERITFLLLISYLHATWSTILEKWLLEDPTNFYPYSSVSRVQHQWLCMDLVTSAMSDLTECFRHHMLYNGYAPKPKKVVMCRSGSTFLIKSNPKNAINEHFLPRFLDFIVWGHEHECLVDPQVKSLIDNASKKAVSRSELKLPLVRIKVAYSGFMTINPQRFGQKYVGKVANPQDILISTKATKKHQSVAEKIDESERLCPEELNQQNIEALVAESNLKMEILPVNNLDVTLHEYVNKDDKMAFYSCLQYNLEETCSKIMKEFDTVKVEEEDLILKVEQCMQAMSV